jgi:hypothetical protein
MQDKKGGGARDGEVRERVGKEKGRNGEGGTVNEQGRQGEIVCVLERERDCDGEKVNCGDRVRTRARKRRDINRQMFAPRGRKSLSDSDRGR